MRECFSLFLWNLRDPQTKELRLVYYFKILNKKYFTGEYIWKMILTDTIYDVKRLLKKITN